MDLPVNEIICGDCLEVMKGMADGSVDTIITDPPYGIGFMGKEWDTFKPENIAEAMEKDKRSHTGIASQRTSNTAGTYDFSRNQEFQQWFTVWGIEALRVLKPGGTLLIFGGTRTYHRLACAVEDAGFILKDCIMWLYGSGFPKAADISKQLDKAKDTKFSGSFTRRAGPTGNKKCEKCGKWLQSGSPCQCPRPQDEQAQLWNGWKSHGLKPAYEPILVAMKANDGTYANNALKHGVSGLNIDGGRIEAKDGVPKFTNRGEDSRSCYANGLGGSNRTGEMDTQTGRFPANVILDEEAGRMLDEQSGQLKSNSGKPMSCKHKKNNCFGQYTPQITTGISDSGGASRFFYCAKASKKERNAGCEGKEATLFSQAEKGLEKKAGGSTVKGWTEDIKRGLDRNRPTSNHHPTVKPLALMEYLCTLTKTPTGGNVLDPFMGSGTTGVACRNTGREFIGIEKEAEYCQIAQDRIRAVETNVPVKEARKGQLPLFTD